MQTHLPVTFIAAVACALGASGCGDSSQSQANKPTTNDSGSGTSGRVDCGALPADVEQRFTTIRGPLGCTPTTSRIPDPPDGCTGVDQLLSSARAEYSALWSAAGCTSTPLDLSATRAHQEREFAAEHPFVAHQIPTHSGTIAAREFGAELASSAPTIVLMHGFPDNQHLYDRLAPLLAAHYHTITFDFVGWGDSTPDDPTRDYTFSDWHHDIDDVLAYFGTTAVVPIVHDASGWPGIDWALDHPDSVSALVLLNTTYQPLPGLETPYVIRALASLDLRPTYISAVSNDELLLRAMFRAQVGEFFDDSAQRATYLPLLESFALATRPALFSLTATIGDTVVATVPKVARLRAFPKPVLVAFGADDRVMTPSLALALAQSFPDGRYVPIEQANHYVQFDQPQALADAIGRMVVEGVAAP